MDTKNYSRHIELSNVVISDGFWSDVQKTVNSKVIPYQYEALNDRIETAEKLGLLKDVISAVSDNNTNIVSANIKTKNHVGIIEIGLELDNIDTLKKVIACIQSLPDVYSVKRIQTSSSMVKKSSPTKSSKSYKHKKTTKKKDES